MAELTRQSATTGDLEKYPPRRFAWGESSGKEGQELHAVVRQRDATRCRVLIDQGANVHTVDGVGMSLLMVACEIGKFEIVKLLVDRGADVNYKKANGTTPLHIASSSNHLSILELLIRNGAEVDAVTSGSTTSLFVAAAGGHASIVRCLCQAGAAVNGQNHRGWTPLHAACQSGNPNAIDALLYYGSDVEYVTSGTCSTPLHVAAMNGNLEAAEKLIDLGGASMNARQADNFTPLMLACNGGILPLVQMLLKKGADPDALGSNLRTALHVAAVGGHASVIQELLNYGAEKNAKSDHGSTPVLLATNGGHVEAVQILLQSGADVYDANTTKPSPVIIATQRSFTTIAEMFVKHLGLGTIMERESKPLTNVAAAFGHLSLVKMLVQSGMDPLLSERERSMNALHEASLKGHVDIVCYLLSLGVDVDVKNAVGETSLHLAAKSAHVDVAECLLKHGADAHVYRHVGHTALHFAAARGDIPLARLLLEADADLEASHGNIGTPLYIAAERGQVYMTRFLLKRGAAIDRPCTEHCRTPLHAAASMGNLAVIEALLTAGANMLARNNFMQHPEEIIGSKKSLTVVERALIESTFCRYKKSKKHQDTKTGRPLVKHGRKPETAKSPPKIFKSEICEVEEKPQDEAMQSGEDPKGSVEVEDSPTTVTDDPTEPHIVDQLSETKLEGTPLFDIKECVAGHHGLVRPETARHQRRTSFGWSRLQRQPGSARTNYRCAATESPRKAPHTKSDSRRLSRSGGVPPTSSVSSMTKPPSNPAVVPYKSQSVRESSGSEGRCVFKRIPRSRTHSQDSSTQTEQSSFQSKRSGSMDSSTADSKGRSCLFVAANSGNISMIDRLMSSGTDPNIHVEEHGWTPLYAAARNGHVEVVKALLQYGARVNETINSGATAMHGACAFGQEQVARLLIDHGAQLDCTTQNGELPLHTAARNGYMHVVSLLLSLDQSLINRQRFNDGSTALHLAVEKQWAGAVKELIDLGADPGIAKADGITPLYLTSIPGNKSIAQMILNSSVPFNVNHQTDENWTALHVACARGDLEMVRLLLRSGADPTLKTNMDMTPADVICEWVMADGGRTQRIRDIIERPPTETSYMLVEAAANGDTKQVTILLDDGADMNVFGDEGLTPLLYAVRNSHITTVHFLVLRKARINLSSCPGSISALHYAVLGTSHQLVEFLLGNGADVRAQDETGQTALHYACHRGFSMAVSLLLAYRADVHANDKHGKTPLFMAAASNSYEAASLLLRNQAYPSCAAADGNTPLHVASEVGGNETVHLLLCGRCDPNAKNAKRETPLMLAAKHGRCATLHRLMQHDVSLDAQDAEGNSALHIACLYGQVEVVEMLLRSPQINLKLKNKKGRQCNEVIGQLAGDRFEKRDREHIIRLLMPRLSDVQYEEHPLTKDVVKSDVAKSIESFKCPITKQIMRTPVLAADGHTYEYTAITEWIKRKGTSPVNKLKLSHTSLQHNYKLKSKIDAWKRHKR